MHSRWAKFYNIWYMPLKAVPTAWLDNVDTKSYAQNTHSWTRKKGRWGAIICKWLQILHCSADCTTVLVVNYNSAVLHSSGVILCLMYFCYVHSSTPQCSSDYQKYQDAEKIDFREWFYIICKKIAPAGKKVMSWPAMCSATATRFPPVFSRTTGNNSHAQMQRFVVWVTM